MASIIKASQKCLYRRNQHLELFAQMAFKEMTLELHAIHSSGIRVYESIFSEIRQGITCLSAQQIFTIMSSPSDISIQQQEKHEVTIKVLSKIRSQCSFEIVLQEKKRGLGLQNLVLVSIMESSQGEKKEEFDLSESFIELDELDPILHKSQKHQFKASYDPKQKKIQTSLYINDSSGKQKLYKNSIDDGYFSKELKNSFKCLEYLFEHLRNQNNYEVNLERGRISIKNEPQNYEEIEKLEKEFMERRRKKKENLVESRRVKSKMSFDTDMSTSTLHLDLERKIQEDMLGMKDKMEKTFEKKIGIQESRIFHVLKNEIAAIEEDFSDRLYEISKGIVSNQEKKAKEKKVDIEILEEWRDSMGRDLIAKMAQEDKKVKNQLASVISEAKRELAIIIHKLRSQFDSLIRENEDKCMASIDDLETDLCKKIEVIKDNKILSTTQDDTTSVATSKFQKEKDWNPIEADPTSLQYKKFSFEINNTITNNGGFEWTQLFTKNLIPHGKIISFQFKIIKSAFNAIAIGVSDRANICQKTSLSLKNSIAFWGDRELWEGKKIKEEEIGFITGDIVTMKVNTIKGEIMWSVEGSLRARHSSAILRDSSLHLMAYVQMYDKGDKIQFLSFNLNES